MSPDYLLHVVCVQDLTWKPKGFHFNKPNLYVTVKLGNSDLRTSTIKRNSEPTWNEFLELSSPDFSSISHVELVHQSSVRQDRCVGWIDVDFSSLLQQCPNGEVIRLLLNPPSGPTSTTHTGVLQVRLVTADATSSTQIHITAAGTALQQSGITRSAEASDSTAVTIVGTSSNMVSQGGDLYQSVGSLLAKLDVFVGAMDALSETHPYLKLAWTVTSALYKVVSDQFKYDKKVIDLVHCMEEAFGFVEEIGSLRYKTQSLQDVITRLLQQTAEGCLFVQHYVRRTFAKRVLDISSKTKIDDFEQTFLALKRSLDSGVGGSIAFISSRITDKVDNLILSDRLQPDQMNAFDRPQCLPGTRVELLAEIQKFLVSDAEQNILWLHGVAGSGKSTVSSTIAQYFRKILRLGAFLFFQRGKSHPSTVIRTLACKLASFDVNIAKHVVAAIEQDNDIAEASASTQFEKLLLEPLKAAADDMEGPVIVILDALDECGDAQSRPILMQLIQRQFPKLPKNFRFLITSRKENDIAKVLSSQQDSVHEMQLDSDSQSSHTDVLSYISSKMHEVVRENVPVPPTWPWDANMVLLGKAAGGLFIWASTAVKLVDGSDDPFRKLKEIVACTRLPNGFDLSSLYSTVLRNSGISWNDSISTARLQQVLSLILFSEVSLTVADIDGILGFDHASSSLLVLSRLQSVLVYSDNSPVRLLHASFSDYLLAPGRSAEPWFIDISVQSSTLAARCFTIMNNLLRFNICGIESSYLPNERIARLPDRIQERIPSHLSYACLFWSHHLREVPFSPALRSALLDLLCTRLLYWLEVLSFLKRVNKAYPILSVAMLWIGSRDTEASSLLKDASTIITRFAGCITHSAPHIYVSMLPFMPEKSKLSRHYLQRVSSLVQVHRKGNQRLPHLLKEIRGHEDCVMSVAFSPDGSHVASGSDDKTVRIWDTQTGELVSGPFEGHAGVVNSVAFSLDGTRVASGSDDKTIRVWDPETGGLISGPFEGHAGAVNSVVFSPSATRVASGSDDKTVRIWDVQTGVLVSGPFEGHAGYVTSVSFSPDGTRIASGSDDKTVRIWDAHTGVLISGPFEGHAGWVTSVAFSPDGTRVASGSQDMTIRVWDTETGGPVSGPFEGHTGVVNSVAFSHDGTRVASGSWDKTIRIWDAPTGKLVSGPFEGHVGYVTSVSFSPDATRVASGSYDQTVRFWDAQTGGLVSGPFLGHTDVVYSISFSPDGTRVASGSDDKTVRIWDAQTGELVAGPFEGHAGWVTSVAFSHDGTRVASGSQDMTIRVWGAEAGGLVSRPFEGHTDVVNSVAFSPDGTRVASGSLDETIRIWDAPTGKLVSGPFEGHVGYVTSVSFSPDGTRFASGSYDQTVRIWDVQTGVLVAGPFEGHTDVVNSVAFSHDGTRVASGSSDGTIRIWDAQSGQLSSGPFEGHTDVVNSVAFSHDGTRVASGSSDGTIRIWDAQSGQLSSGPFEGHTDVVNSVAFSPDGTRVASGSRDKTVRVWDAQTGELVSGPFEGHADWVRSIAFSPDGTRVASGSDDKTIRITDTRVSFFETCEGSMYQISSVPDQDLLSSWTLSEDGWVVGKQNELLLWVPPELRLTLWRPHTVAMLSCDFSTRLDFTHAAIGERWQECYNPR